MPEVLKEYPQMYWSVFMKIQCAILSFLEDKGGSTAHDIAKHIGGNSRGMLKHINALVARGIVEVVGFAPRAGPTGRPRTVYRVKPGWVADNKGTMRYPIPVTTAYNARKVGILRSMANDADGPVRDILLGILRDYGEK